jgi:hypothetical protein
MPPHPLAAFRVLLGLFLLAYFLRYLPCVSLCFSSAGVYATYLIPDPAPPPVVAWVIYALSLVAVVGFVLGIATRVVAPAVFVAFLYHYFLHLATMDTSFDRLLIVFLAVLCCARLDAAWSLWPWRPRNNAGRAAAEAASLVPAWPARLIALQLSFVYLGSGLFKLFNPAWWDGKVLEFTFASPWGTDLAFGFVGMGWPQWLYDAAAFGVIAFELACGVALYVPKLRGPFIVVGLLFHAGIALFLGIWQFLCCPLAYVLFLPPERVKRVGGWTLRRARRRPDPIAGA